MKYYVIAIHWDEAKEVQCKYIAGEFPNIGNASVFAEAYKKHYKSKAMVVDEFVLLYTNFMETDIF